MIGFGRVGRMVAQMLERHGKTFIAVDADADTVRRARDEGYPIVFGDVARPGFVEKLDLGHAASLVLTMDNPVQNVATTRSEEHTSELQSLMRISYAVFCLKKKNYIYYIYYYILLYFLCFILLLFTFYLLFIFIL